MYSEGNLKLCDPRDVSRGSVPALGTTFQERVSVTFLWFLRGERKRTITFRAPSFFNTWNMYAIEML